MCVTNIAKRRNVSVSHGETSSCRTPSVISQRLMSNFMPLMMNNARVSQALPGTDSTWNSVEMHSAVPQHGSENSFFYQQQNPYVETQEDKTRPKRRRKPQKPGKTAKQNDRHFVLHNYHDHSWDPDETDSIEDEPRRRGGVAVSFPSRLHTVLDQVGPDGWGHVISWQPHGRCFLIHKPNDFQEQVMPAYFGQKKLTSFQRQLNLYGFCRLTRGKDAGAYYHEMFLKGKFFLTKKMLRTKIKGTKFKASSNPEQEPDFYSMTPILPSGHQTVSDDSSFGESIGNESPLCLVSNMAISKPQLPSIVSPTAASAMESFPFQDLGGGPVPFMETYNSLMQGRRYENLVFNQMTTVRDTFKSSTDEILDEAVDELFEDAKTNNWVELNQGDDFSPLWDTTEFGQEAREDDLQLGFMLDLFLHE